MKKEIKHNCADGMVFSNKKGRCIKPDVPNAGKEKVDGAENPDSRDKVPNRFLRFPHTRGAGVQGVKNEKKKTLPRGW